MWLSDLYFGMSIVYPEELWRFIKEWSFIIPFLPREKYRFHAKIPPNIAVHSNLKNWRTQGATVYLQHLNGEKIRKHIKSK